ncbi:MAG: leucine-rich repeat domain-containing protein [Christensenellales bacterium]
MKSNKKRIVLVLAILTMAIVLSFVFVACGNDTNKTGTEKAADYKVTIHPNNGQGDIVWDITKEIPTITKDGYHIAGCFLDAQLTTNTTLESLKATELTKNIDVYVKWEKHVESTDAAVEPTCTEPGLTEGKHCSVCNEILKAQTEIPALGHTGGTATCIEQATCERCNEKYGNALGHDLEHHDGQPATCTEKGWKAYVTCKREGCDHTTYEKIPALGHTGGTATCTEQATCERCNEKYGNALGHDIEHHAGQPATCTEKGWKAYVTCKREGCDYSTYKEIPALGHTGGTATCTEQATCSVCGEKYGNLAKHDYKNGICSSCGDIYVSEGLAYALNSDGNGYSMTGIGECVDKNIYIPFEYNSKPVTRISGYAFYNCIELTSIAIPDSITNIDGYAFSGCTGLTSITIPDSVTSIGSFAFQSCFKLQDIYITDIAAWCNISGLDNLMRYGSSNKKLYINNELATSITIPNGVTTIPTYAFYCSSLTSITIPDSVTSIGDHAFYGCYKLVEVYNKSTLTITAGSSNNGYIAYYAKDVYATEGESKLSTDENGYVIYTDRDEKILLSYVGTETELTLPSYITQIYQNAFRDCTGLTSVTIGNSVTSIGDSAFEGCRGLTSVTIPDSVTSIGKLAFFDCTGLTSITIGKGVTSIGISAFSKCRELTSISVVEGNTKYHCAGNCLIETESKTLVFGCKTSVIPTDGSVTSIGVRAFANCSGLTSIIIPDSVTSIGNFAFDGCTGLTGVTIGSGVTNIGEEAFWECTSLTNITFNGTIEEWGAISKGPYWNSHVPRECKVVCKDGTTSI